MFDAAHPRSLVARRVGHPRRGRGTMTPASGTVHDWASVASRFQASSESGYNPGDMTIERTQADRGLPFSKAVTVQGAGRWVFLAGQLGSDETGQPVHGGPAAEAAQAFARLLGALRECGGSAEHVVRISASLTSLANASPVFAGARPGSSTGSSRSAPPPTVCGRDRPPARRVGCCHHELGDHLGDITQWLTRVQMLELARGLCCNALSGDDVWIQGYPGGQVATDHGHRRWGRADGAPVGVPRWLSWARWAAAVR